MIRYMLDSNTCIFVMKQMTPAIVGRFNRLAAQLSISTISLGELRLGCEKSRRLVENHSVIDNFVARLTVLDFDADAARDYGQIRLALRRQPIGPLDTLIAAHALSRDLIMVTDNVSEFKRVPGLLIENWHARPRKL